MKRKISSIDLLMILYHVMKKNLFRSINLILDSTYAEFLSDKEFKSLWKICILVFCLGQSAVERGFHTNDGYTVENHSEFSLMALQMIHGHMRANDVAPHNIQISKDLRISVVKSRQRYGDYMKQNNQEKEVSERDLKRKIIGDEIQEVQKKKRFFTVNY